jgi:hypothetical protein
MKPVMTPAEFSLFESFIRCSRDYVEFGAGGSTYVAARHVSRSILSIESSVAWIDKVRQACQGPDVKTQPEMIHADIGPTGDLGYPSDADSKPSWPRYHAAIWVNPRAGDADLYMVDGRFRVACFLQILLHCRRDALIMIHDFNNRPHYHVVREVAREVAIADTLSAFLPSRDDRSDHIRALLKAYEYEPR